LNTTREALAERPRLVRSDAYFVDLPAKEIDRRFYAALAVIKRGRKADAPLLLRGAGSSLTTTHRLPYWLT
jgi:hypothetical protein